MDKDTQHQDIYIYIYKDSYKNQSRREYENKYIKEIAKK